MTKKTLQFEIKAVIELKVDAETLEGAIEASKVYSWSNFFYPKTEIVDGKYRLIGVYEDWDLEDYKNG